MSFSIASMPLWLSFLLVVVLPTTLSVCGALLTRRAFGLDRLQINNEVAGFKFAVVGVIYAVLLGFAVIVMWEKFRDAEVAVDQEASDVVTIARLSEGLTPTVGAALRQTLIIYAHDAVVDDWPAMARGQSSAKPARALDALYRAVLADEPATPHATAVMGELLTRMDSLTQARRTRLLLASGSVPAVLWAVLFGGAFVTLSFTFFFGVRSVGSQVVMNILLSTLIFMVLYVAVEIDHPFSGPTSVGPEALRAALDGHSAGDPGASPRTVTQY